MGAEKRKMQVMTLTDEAAARIRDLMAKADDSILGLRVGVKNGGCAGMEYTLEYAREQKPFEDVIDDKGARVFIDPKAILFLFGTQMDFKTDKLASQFVFNNPNQISACGCGESVEIKPADPALMAAGPA